MFPSSSVNVCGAVTSDNSRAMCCATELQAMQVVQAIEAGSGSTISVIRTLLLPSVQHNLLSAEAALSRQQCASLETLNTGIMVEPGSISASVWCDCPSTISVLVLYVCTH